LSLATRFDCRATSDGLTKPADRKRPLVVTAFCCVALASELYGAFRLAASGGSVPPHMLIGGLIASALLFGSLYGIWRMKAWGPIAYVGCYLFALANGHLRNAAGQIDIAQVVLLCWIALAVATTLPFRNRFG